MVKLCWSKAIYALFWILMQVLKVKESLDLTHYFNKNKKTNPKNKKQTNKQTKTTTKQTKNENTIAYVYTNTRGVATLGSSRHVPTHNFHKILRKICI